MKYSITGLTISLQITSNLAVYPMQPLNERDPETFPAPVQEAKRDDIPMQLETTMSKRSSSPIMSFTKFAI